MIDEAEAKEMRQELEAEFGSGRQHPRVLFQRAIEQGDEGLARLIGEVGRRYVHGGEAASLGWMVRTHFPPDEAEQKRLTEQAREQRTSEIGSSLQALVNERRQRKLAVDSKPYIGWNVPPKEGVEYKRPDSGGFNVPPKV